MDKTIEIGPQNRAWEGIAMNMLLRPVRSSVGSKYLMAVTGLLLIGFVLAHMSGNLLIFAGPDALNSYAQALKEKPPLLWTARLGLLAVFLLHVILGIRLTMQNKAARPVPYSYEDTLQASWASRNMMLTGLVLLAFVIYHLAHFTLGVVVQAEVTIDKVEQEKNYLELTQEKDLQTGKYISRPDLNLSQPPRDAMVRHDVYTMVVAGFRKPLISLSYLVAMAFLGLHLWHGGSSWLLSLGWTSKTYRPVVRAIGPILAVIVVAGNCSIPLAVWLGIVK